MTCADPPRSHLSGCVKKLSSNPAKNPGNKKPRFRGAKGKEFLFFNSRAFQPTSKLPRLFRGLPREYYQPHRLVPRCPEEI